MNRLVTNQLLQDFLGSVKTQIAHIVGSAGMQLVLPVELNGKPLPKSRMVLRAEKLAENGGESYVLNLQVKRYPWMNYEPESCFEFADERARVG